MKTNYSCLFSLSVDITPAEGLIGKRVRINVTTAIVLLTCLLAGYSQTSHAHDPGLSFARVYVLNNMIRMQLSFSQKDIETLVAIELDQTGSVRQSETENILSGAERIILNSVYLSRNNIRTTAEKILVSSGLSETIKVHLEFPYRTQEEVRLAVPLIALFPRGHRQHLTVLDGVGIVQFRKILDATTDPIIFNAKNTGHTAIFQLYVKEGLWHIWIGFDHILFLVTLLLPAVLILGKRQWSSVQKFFPALMDTLKIVTAFTAAHSITLGLAVFEIVQLPVRLIESVIAFSVLIVAINNLWPVFSSSRWLLAFVFGLIHGFGFANVLTDLGLPPGALLLSLAGFNLGVEAGQIAIVALLMPLFYLIRHTVLYRKWIFSGGSMVAAVIASVWMVERIYGIEMLAF